MTPDMSRQVITTILLSTARLRNMVDNILDAAKIKKGGLESQREPFSRGQGDGGTPGLFRPQAEEFGRDFRLEVPESLPVVMGDESQTYRLLCNLLTNAFKFTSSGDRICFFRNSRGGSDNESFWTPAPGSLPTTFQPYSNGFKRGKMLLSRLKNSKGLALA